MNIRKVLKMEYKTKTTVLFLTVCGLVIYTLVKCVKLAATGDYDAMAVYLIGGWIICGILIFTAKIGNQKGIRLILFSFPSALVFCFGIIYLPGGIRYLLRPDVRLDFAVENDWNSYAEKILKKSRKDLKSDDLQEALYTATYHGNNTLLPVLIAAGARINQPSDARDELPLFGAIGDGKLDTARTLLKLGADVTATTKDGVTALHIAADRRKPDFIRLFLASGADPDSQDAGGRTPLHYALQGISDRNIDVIKVLLAAGADPNIPDKRGYPPENSIIGDNEITRLLEEHGARRVEVSDGLTDLHMAVDDGDTAGVRRILKSGFPVVDVRDDEDLTALMHAVKNEYAELTRMLADAGADVNAVSRQGYTPLILAAASGSLPIANILLTHGADVNKSVSGFTPLNTAVMNEQGPCILFLLKHGARIDKDTEEYASKCDNPSIRKMILDRVPETHTDR